MLVKLPMIIWMKIVLAIAYAMAAGIHVPDDVATKLALCYTIIISCINIIASYTL